jgi:hypothetical protein
LTLLVSPAVDGEALSSSESGSYFTTMEDVAKQPGTFSCASSEVQIGVSYRHKTLGDNEYPPDEGPATIADAVPLKRPLANWCSN